MDLYLAMEQPKEALMVAKETEALSPDELNVLIALGRAYSAAGRKDLAQTVFQRASTLAGFEVDKLMKLAAIQRATGAIDDAPTPNDELVGHVPLPSVSRWEANTNPVAGVNDGTDVSRRGAVPACSAAVRIPRSHRSVR